MSARSPVVGLRSEFCRVAVGLPRSPVPGRAVYCGACADLLADDGRLLLDGAELECLECGQKHRLRRAGERGHVVELLA